VDSAGHLAQPQSDIPAHNMTTSGSDTVPPGVTLEQLNAVLRLGDQMLSTVFGGRRRALAKAAELTSQSLGAENCSIFLVSAGAVLPEEPRWLELEASANESWNRQPGNKVRLMIESKPGGSLTGHLAKQGQPVVMDYEQLRACPYAVQEGLSHLRDGKRFSVLAVPLRGRRD
jgi:hypothetical protein